jgi:hypothetical protein
MLSDASVRWQHSLFTVLYLNMPFCLTDRAEETGVNTVIRVQPIRDLRFYNVLYLYIFGFNVDKNCHVF